MSGTAAATAAPAQTTFLGNLWTTLKTDASKVWSAFTNVVQHDAFPFVETLFSTIALDNIKALQPLAEAALSEIEADLPLLFSQGAAGFLKAFNTVGASLLQKAEGAALNVTETDILTAAHAVLINAKAKLGA